MALENDFLVWAPGGGQVMTQENYSGSTFIENGVITGLADPTLYNKSVRQTSIMASVLAQFIVNNADQPVIDDGTTATILANLQIALEELITHATNTWEAVNTFVSGLISTGYDTQGANIRVVGGGYGLIIRNDGNNTYLLLTNNGSPLGSFNGLRPFTINDATGGLTIDSTGAGVGFGGNISASAVLTPVIQNAGGPLYLESNQYIAAVNPAVNNYVPLFCGSSDNANAAVIFSQFQFDGAGTGYLILPNGFTLQWGNIVLGTAPNQVVGFPYAFPNGCIATYATFGAIPTAGETCGSAPNGQYSLLIGNAGGGINDIFWLAIGY